MKAKNPELISVVVPAYNEQEVLGEFHRRVSAVLGTLDSRYEIVYVNDGSKDGTMALLEQLQSGDSHVTIIDLSRNFGKEIALTAGLDHAQGDVTVVIDADLQDPPELIPELLESWREGFDVVYAKRRRRSGETFMKKITAHYFYRLMRKTTRIDIPEDTGDYRLLSRRAVNAVCSLREHHRFMKGVFSWIGYPQKAVFYDRDARAAGETKWGYWKLWNFALEGITSFTTIPLRLATYIGFFTAIVAFARGVYIIVKTLIFGDPVPGFPTLAVLVLFLGGIQLMAIGVIGEYLGRIFNETKSRPLYFLNSYLPSNETRKFLNGHGNQSVAVGNGIAATRERAIVE